MFSQGSSATTEQRDRLLRTNEQLDSQTDMLESGKRRILEIEQVGTEITTELARNREKIESAHSKVRLGMLWLYGSFSGLVAMRRTVEGVQRGGSPGQLAVCARGGGQVKETSAGLDEAETVVDRMGRWMRNLY